MAKPSTSLLLAVIVIATLAGLVFAIANKHKTLEPQQEYVEGGSSEQFIEEVEQKAQQEKDEKDEVKKQEKRIRDKKESVECKFWMQQQKTAPSKRVDEKIAQFCNLQ